MSVAPAGLPPPRRGARRPEATRSGRAATPSISGTGAGSTRGSPGGWWNHKRAFGTGALNALSARRRLVAKRVGMPSSPRGGVALRTVDKGTDWVSQNCLPGSTVSTPSPAVGVGLRSVGVPASSGGVVVAHANGGTRGPTKPSRRDGHLQPWPALRPWTVMRSVAPVRTGAAPSSPRPAVKTG